MRTHAAMIKMPSAVISIWTWICRGNPEEGPRCGLGHEKEAQEVSPNRRKNEGRKIQTPNLLIWSQTRCRCAIPPMINASRFLLSFLSFPNITRFTPDSLQRLDIRKCNWGRRKRLFHYNGVAQWLARWAHSPKVHGLKPRSAKSCS